MEEEEGEAMEEIKVEPAKDIKQEPEETPDEDEGEVGEPREKNPVVHKEEEEKEKAKEKDEPPEDAMEEDINVTDSQVMIQLKEAEEEAAKLREEIEALRAELDVYMCKVELTEKDEARIQEIQEQLMEKIALLDALTKRIAKLMELAGKTGSEDTTILDEEEEEGFPDDLLPRVVICSSWDDMMPKVVVCMDMKKPGAAKKNAEDDRDENGLTPEQREALEQERRCMAEERNRLQYQIACLEGEMRVMMRENDMLSRKVAQLKSEIDNQPPFEFEMSVSATNPPGCGAPKTGNMDMGFGVMGPKSNGQYTMGAALSPGAEVQGKLAISGQPTQFPPGYSPPHQGCSTAHQQGDTAANGGGHGYPCGGVTGIPGKSVACSRLQQKDQQQQQQQPQPNDWTTMLPPYGKRCRKDFNKAQSADQAGGCGSCPGCGGGGCGACSGCGRGGCGGCSGCAGGGCGGCSGCGGGMNHSMQNEGMTCGMQTNGESFLPPMMMKKPPMDVNFKVNVQPQAVSCNKRVSMDADAKSNKIAQQLQEIEMELKRMQRDLCKAKKDKETLKAQQDTLTCAKNYIT